MNSTHPRNIVVAAVLAVVTSTVGCREKTDVDQNAVQARNIKPGPEESFESIVETFKRGIEDVPIGFVLQNEEGHSMMTGRNEVSHKLIPPAKDGEPYKAVITVSSQSRYSLQQTIGDEEEKEDEQPDEQQGVADPAADAGAEIFDRELISAPTNKTQERRSSPTDPEKSDKKVTRQADQQERHYELVYLDGKWSLITPLDPETEQAIENAFKHALEMQI